MKIIVYRITKGVFQETPFRIIESSVIPHKGEYVSFMEIGDNYELININRESVNG